MIRIRGHAKEKVNSKIINDWKRKAPVAFFIEIKRIIKMCIHVMVIGMNFRKIIQRDKLKYNKDRLLNGGERT